MLGSHRYILAMFGSHRKFFRNLGNMDTKNLMGHFQMPHQLVLKYLSSKTNFVFNQTLFTLFRERYAMMTPSDFFWRPFWKSYSLRKAKFYLLNPSSLAKSEKTHRSITLEQEINPVQIPHPSKATFKFPPPGHNAQSNARGMPRGVDV